MKAMPLRNAARDGEVRPVQSGQERLKEAAKHGFKTAIVPYGNVAKKSKCDRRQNTACGTRRGVLA
jgi:predicted ATP-dependent serine protease